MASMAVRQNVVALDRTAAVLCHPNCSCVDHLNNCPRAGHRKSARTFWPHEKSIGQMSETCITASKRNVILFMHDQLILRLLPR